MGVYYRPAARRGARIRPAVGLGIEYFLAERAKVTARMTEIMVVMSNPKSIAMPSSIPALKRNFKVSYATMSSLYEVIDTGGTTKGAKSPFHGLTKDEAKELAAEMVDTKSDYHGTELKEIVAWVGSHLTTYKFPIYP